jgi:hypothetical protein
VGAIIGGATGNSATADAEARATAAELRTAVAEQRVRVAEGRVTAAESAATAPRRRPARPPQVPGYRSRKAQNSRTTKVGVIELQVVTGKFGDHVAAAGREGDVLALHHQPGGIPPASVGRLLVGHPRPQLAAVSTSSGIEPNDLDSARTAAAPGGIPSRSWMPARRSAEVRIIAA